MQATDVLLWYLASALLVGVLGAAVAFDRHRSSQVRTCAAWVAMTCFVWPLTTIGLAAVVVGEVRRRRHDPSRSASVPVGAGRRSW